MNVKKFFSPEGFGNVGYDFPPNSAAGVLNAANDGLSTDLATGKIAQLGQTVGRAGNPAILTEDREIPDGGHRLFFGKNDGVSNVIGFDTSLGVFVSNNTGQGYSAFWQIGLNSTVFQIQTSDGLDTFLSFGGGVAEIIWNSQSGTSTINKFLVDSAPWIMGSGEGVRITPVVSAVTPAYNVLNSDAVINANTAGGNLVININPAVVGLQRITIKKVSSDVNTITVTPTSGTIQELGAPAATFVFNVQGQSITIVNDATNFYII